MASGKITTTTTPVAMGQHKRIVEALGIDHLYVKRVELVVKDQIPARAKLTIELGDDQIKALDNL